MKYLKSKILAVTLASTQLMGMGYNVHALETKPTSHNIMRAITYMQVTGNSVNVRTGPSTSYKSIMKLNKGNRVEYISNSGNWSKIKYNGKEGYISNNYIKPVSTTSTYNDIRIITGNSVNFRKGPGTNYSVIKSFSKGTQVNFISQENNWIKVNYNGTVGYVFSQYVSNKTTTDNPSTDNNTSITLKYVTGNSVNFRKGPGTNYSVIGSFSKGTQVEFISNEGNWAKIKHNGTIGYISNNYLSSTKPTEPTKPEIQGEVLFPDWFKGGQDILVRDDYASNLNNAFTVEDYKTGKTFKVIRTGGTSHADVEPLTAADTATMKSIWGGFNWTRRPILVHINGKIYGASMSGMPHSGLDSEPAREYTSKNRSDNYGAGINYDSVKNNDADGHVDIHFLNSKTHGSDRLDTAHQNNIKTLMNEFN